MQKRTPLIIIVTLALFALPTGAAPTQTVSKDYTFGVGDLGADCAQSPDEENRGGACFDVPAGTIAAAVHLADRLPRPVSALVTHFQGKQVYTSWYLCETWQWLGVPPGTTSIRIDLQTVGGLMDCGAAAPATEGTITITWYDAS